MNSKPVRVGANSGKLLDELRQLLDSPLLTRFQTSVRKPTQMYPSSKPFWNELVELLRSSNQLHLQE